MKVSVSTLAGWVVILVLAGYPIVSYIPSILAVTSTPISIAFRLLYVVFSIMTIGYAFSNRERFGLNVGHVMFLIFWFIYSIRLVVDLSIIHVPLYEQHDAFYFYSLAFGGALIPCLAIICWGKKMDIFWILRRVYVLFFVFILILLFLLLIGSNIPYFHNGRLVANENLNSITTGHAGVSLALLGMAFLFNNAQYAMRRSYLYFAIFSGLGIAFYSGARSPLIVVGMIMLLVILRIFSQRRINAKIFKGLVVVVSAIILVGVFYILPNLDSGEFRVIERLNKSGGAKEVRSTVWKNAAYQFLHNPIVGDQFLERSNGKYPHNILLEVPMATGILGAIPFFFMLVVLIKRVVYLFLNVPLALPLLALFFQFFLWNLTSGSLFGSGGLWVLIVLLLTLPTNNFELKHND